MLPRRLRLTQPHEFQAVRRRGRRWRDMLFTLHTLPNGLEHCRFGFVVSRQVGSAVVRNTVKRRLRAAVRRWLPECVGGYDAVIVAHPAAAQAPYQALEQISGEIFRRAHLIAPSGEEALT